jgi:hypothetical protein
MKKPENKTKLHEHAELAKKYSLAVLNAQNRNIDFLLSLNDFNKLMKQNRCYYCGINTVSKENGDSTPNLPNTKTRDRKISSIGYTPENTVVSCHSCNQSKASLEKHLEISIKEGRGEGFKKMLIKTLQDHGL